MPKSESISALSTPPSSMSALTSPVSRPNPSLTPSSSRRTSIDTSRSSPSRTPTQPQANRRNRAALRDYYNLKAAAPAEASSGVQQEETVKESELDKDGFEAEKYVTELLGKEGLEGLLKVEGGLVNQIKFLDGERKALVYDNYSKLITATDTIKRMRANMDPLAPTTSTLSPAVSHIAVTAQNLAKKLQPEGTDEERKRAHEQEQKLQRDKETVKWVLDGPRRLPTLEKDEAEEELLVIEGLLVKWKGVEGVEQIRDQCKKAVEALGDEGQETD